MASYKEMKNSGYTVYFAKTNFRGVARTFGIRMPDRRQHMYVVGKTGVGKTNVLKNIALQDIAHGAGLAIVDPHGSFVEEVLEKIPEDRMDDVIYFNPADSDYPIGFNVLEVSDPKYKHLVASDLMGIFTKIWANVWSARMEYILNNCVLALLDTPGSTLLGIQRMLVDKDYRRRIVDNIKDPVVRSFWIQEYESYNDRLRTEAIAPIQNKVGQFLSTTFVRNIVGQPKSAINVFDIMNSGKILLVNVAKGRIGEDNSALLGAMIITKIQLAAMERVRVEEEERKDFYLYVDEFQNFATDSFASILSEARKYRLNIVIAHQYIGQLITDTTTKVRDAVFGNVGTMIIFRVGATDAEFLEKEFTPEFEIQDLVGLPNHHIYLKLMVNGETSRPFSATTLPPIEVKVIENSAEKIIADTRKKYSRPRQQVEEEIERWASGLGEEATAGAPAAVAGREEKFETTCSVCGKPTTVSFKPDGKRPVYCTTCLKKVQSGEIPAPPVMSFTKASYGESLAELGIEFRAEKSSGSPQPKKAMPPLKASSPIIKNFAEKSISLKDLASRHPQPHQGKRGPDLDGLKKALKDALGEQKIPQSPKQDPAQKEKNEGAENSENSGSAKVLKPGQPVKL